MSNPFLNQLMCNRFNQRLRFVNRLLVFLFRDRVGNDTASGLYIRSLAPDENGADGDARIHIMRKAEIPDAPRIRAAPGILQLVDYLHGAYLRAPAYGAGGKTGAQ